MLDPGLGDADDFDVALERFVLAAGPNRESALIGYFLRQTTREMLAYRDTDVGQSASHVQIAPLVCDNASFKSGPAGCPSLVEFGAAGHPGPPIGCNQHQIGRAHVCTPVTHAHTVCPLTLEHNKTQCICQ